MNALFAIAANSFKEARREKFFLVVALVALAFVAAANAFLKIDIGHERLRFVFDFTNGALGFFGAIAAIVLTCRLFHSELENKTIIPLLSKPVGAVQIVFGKFFGVAAALAVFCVAITLTGAAMLAATEASIPKSADSAALPNWFGFAAFAFLQWTKLCALAAITLLVCAASTSVTFSIIVSFLIFLACLFASATQFLGGGGAALTLATTVLPDISMFSAAEEFAFAPVNFTVFAIIAAYAAAYSAVACVLAAFVFSGREF